MSRSIAICDKHGDYMEFGPTYDCQQCANEKYDHAQNTVQLAPLSRDICAAMRNHDWQSAITLCAAMCLCAGEIAVVATERKCDEILDVVLPE